VHALPSHSEWNGHVLELVVSIDQSFFLILVAVMIEASAVHFMCHDGWVIAEQVKQVVMIHPDSLDSLFRERLTIFAHDSDLEG
jgi:hypothetical protein